MKKNNVIVLSVRRNCCIANKAAVRVRTGGVALFLLLAASSLPVADATPPPSGPPVILPPVILPPVLDDPPDSPQDPAAAPTDVSPEQTTDVSTRIATGCGYDAYSGSVRRTVIDLVVPGAIGSRGLSVVRSYSSLSPWASGWSFSHYWRIEGKPSSGDGYLVYFPDGRISKFKPPRSSQTGETAWRGATGTTERLFLQSTNQYIGTADLWLEDGSRVHFDRSTELSSNDQYPIDYFTLSYLVDPFGQVTTFSYEQIPGTFDLHDIRVNRLTDVSGRFLAYSYDTTSGIYPSQVTASNGQWVRYTWTPWNSSVGRQLSRVDYSDGSFASYTYDRVPVIIFDGTPGTIPRLITAQDTRAEGPMRAIQYEYTANPEKDFSGELKAERHFGDGTLVSTFAHNGGRTSSTDTRGDGPSRTYNMVLADQRCPLVTGKSDFYGRFEYYYYDVNNYLRQVTDRRGYSTVYVNEPILGKPTTITHPDLTYRAYTYSSSLYPYFVSSVRNERGHYTYYHRDGNNRIYQINFPNGAVETFAHNGFGQVTTHRRTNGVYDAYDHSVYDATGRLTKRWDPTPSADYPPSDTLPHHTYTYYSSADVWEWEDRISRITDPLGRITTYEYDRRSDGVQCGGRGLVTRIQYWSDTHDGTLPTGTSQSFGYDAFGNRTSVTDELGHTTRYEYDDYNRVVRVINAMNQPTATSYALDWANPYVHTTQSIKYIQSPMLKNTVFGYDNNFRKSYQIAALNTADEAWTFFDYDWTGNLITKTDPCGQVTTCGKVTTYGYDKRNRQTSVKNEELNETTTFDYDGVGNKKIETRPDTSFRTWDYDNMNRLWHAYDWRMSDPPAAYQTTTYDRDLAGNVRYITDAKGAIYSYDYDLKNLKISETYPPDATGVRRTVAYHYDDVGNLDYFKNPAGQYKHILFDARNRARHAWWDNGVGPDVETHYDPAGRMSDTTTNGGETRVVFGYDDANRQTWEEQTVAGFPTRRVQTPRDDDGNPINLTVPNTYEIQYDYTQRNQLWHIMYGGSTTWFMYSYDLAGNMTRRQDLFPGGVNDSTNIVDAAGVSQYDALNRPMMWEQTGAGNAFLARSHFKYDNVGRLTASWRDEQAGKGEWFGYNTTGQLTGVSYNADGVSSGNPQSASRTVSYTMTPDTLNRSSMNDNGDVSDYTPNQLNQYENVAGGSVYYDGNFNLTWTGGFNAWYDSANHLTWAQSGEDYAQFVYDGLGRCLKRTVNWETTLITYHGWKPIVEWDVWDGQSYFKAWNIYGAGPDEILWRYADRYGHLRYHLDRMGNVAFLLDLNGVVREKYTYDAFGRPTVTDWDDANPRSWSWYGNRFMFTGREWIPELGLYDYRNRFYHPLLGRFLQADPKGFDAGDMNLFRYVGDDPVDKTDPMGLASVPSTIYQYLPPNYYPYRTVVQTWSRLEKPIGTLIPTRVNWEVTRQDFRVSKITVPRYDTRGHITGKREDRPTYAAFTESRISSTQTGQDFNIRWDFDLQFRTDLGPRWQEFVFKTEPQHIQEIVAGARYDSKIQGSIIGAAKQGLPALQSRAESMRHSLTVTSGAQDIYGRHTLRENGIDVPTDQ